MADTLDLTKMFRNIADELAQTTAFNLACELEEAKDALAELMKAVNGIPDGCRVRAPAVGVAMARAEKVLGVE